MELTRSKFWSIFPGRNMECKFNYNLLRPSLEVTIIISKYQMPSPSDSFYQSQYTSKKITVNFNCQSLTLAHCISPFSGFRMTLDTEKDEINGIK